MIRKQFFNNVLPIVVFICWLSTPVIAADLGLVDLLSNQLGVSKDQAQGGAGSIFQLAKKNLGSADFSSIAKAVPGMDKMMGAAPKTEEKSSAFGNVSSMLGGNPNKLQGLAGLAGSFKELGMSGDMVGKFTPIILDYVKNMGGEGTMGLLKGALQ